MHQNNPHHYLEIKLLQRIPKKHDDDWGYEDIEAPALDSPCVLFLGGGDAQSSNVANWQAKISQLMLTGSKTKFPLGIKLVSATYPNPYLKGYGTETELQYMRADPNFHDIESDILVKKQFLPLVADNLKIDCDDNISGDKIDLNRLKKNLRNINIIRIFLRWRSR
ncbi:MAG: hypothetical protein WCL30_03520 [Pseudomonadota bacterium]